MKVNINTYYAELVARLFTFLGIRNACISPGSRSTPLTTAFARNPEIKCYSIIDERASAFFALGLAKAIGTPVAVVTTSGTAAAELLPATVEAFFSRVPIILCTADRPEYLLGKGANQTIFQDGMFSNHIKSFYNSGLPGITELEKYLEGIASAVLHGSITDKGPVHLNFRFDKPLESFIHTHCIQDDFDFGSVCNSVNKLKKRITATENNSEKIRYSEIFNRILNSKRKMIIAGPGVFGDDFSEKLELFKQKFGFAAYAENLSGTRRISPGIPLIELSEAGVLKGKYAPDLILHFGAAPTTASVLKFFDSAESAYKISVNQYDDYNDPSGTLNEVVKASPEEFTDILLNMLPKSDYNAETDLEYLNLMDKCSSEILKLKMTTLSACSLTFEGKAMNIISSHEISEECNDVLFISNSTPARDIEFFGNIPPGRRIYSNRGASGIDGIISSAAGVAAGCNVPVTLVSGDLAFYYDMNSLYLNRYIGESLRIFVFNNSGGGIFKMLPVKDESDIYEEYFRTPADVDFEQICKAFGISYQKIEDEVNLMDVVGKDAPKGMQVIEIETDSDESAKLRRLYFIKATEIIQGIFNEV